VASYAVMFLAVAMLIVSSAVWVAGIVVRSLNIFRRSSTATFGSSMSFSRFVCFQIMFRHSVRAMSGVYRLAPFFRAFLISA
jgi:hypothetical protein